MAGILVLFDFDMTIVDCDCENWVVDQFGLSDLFHHLLPSLAWNSLMNRMMGELHARDRSAEEMAECLRSVPFDPHVIDAIKTAHALGCELRVVSDANVFFIETILKHHGLLQCFSRLHTNPCSVDEHGRLRILPFHHSAPCAYGCTTLCSPTMCKGAVIDGIRASAGFAQGNTKQVIIYVGDGKGDYCPSLRLARGDHVMARKNHPLWNLIRGGDEPLKAEVHEWSSGEELGGVLLDLIRSSANDTNAELAMSASDGQLFPANCKHETAAPDSAAQAGLPVPVRVPI